MTAIRKVYFKIDIINKKSKGKGTIILCLSIGTKKDNETYALESFFASRFDFNLFQ